MLALRASLHDAAADATSARCRRRADGPRRARAGALAGRAPRRSRRPHSVTRLVRKLDDALNNTSLVLLLEVGGLSMLFPGDAQIENWQFTLDRLADEPELKKKLAGIDLYKVGHHGSRNATPRSLHALWVDRPDTLPPLTALMSTRPDVHGETEATAVPRATLVTALETGGHADLHRRPGPGRAVRRDRRRRHGRPFHARSLRVATGDRIRQSG